MLAWLSRRFSRRLAFAFCLTSVAGVLGTGFLVGRFFQKTLIAELTQSLTTAVQIVEAQTDKMLFVRRDTERLEALAIFLARRSNSRVSFIASDGTVLGDSAVSAEVLAAVENHKDRPEVRSALAGLPGGHVRLSHTTGERFLYAAVPVRNGDTVVGVVRTAYPLRKIEEKIGRIRRQIALLSVAVLAFAFLIALAMASSLSRPVREMSEVANRIASGDYHARVGSVGRDEHGRLADALNQLSERVQRTVQELAHDKGQLSVILTNMTEAVVALDAAGRVVTINPALARIFGLEPQNSQGKFFLEVLRHNQINELVRGVLSDRRPRIEEVRTFVPEERIFEAQAAPLFESDRFAGALVVLHDITRLRQLEQVRRDFVANVSHELRTPLTSIKGFAETLEMGALDDPKNALGFVNSIQKQADRMTVLVEDLLDLTAIESGERQPVIEPIVLKDLIDDVVAGLRPQAGRKKIELSVEAPGTLPPVAADRQQLRQILVNLLENSVKFTPAGNVSVKASVMNDMISFIVTDTGVGIPAQDLPRIFERFYRVDKARSREMGGTGLGLSIVKHLVEANGGSISVLSAVGKGSAFQVRLPIYKETTA